MASKGEITKFLMETAQSLKDGDENIRYAWEEARRQAEAKFNRKIKIEPIYELYKVEPFCYWPVWDN